MPSERDQERLGETLRDAYRDVVPTPDERQRHLSNIEQTLPGMTPIPWRRQRGLLEAVVVVTVLVLVVGGFAFWEARDGSPGGEIPEPVAGASASVTVTRTEPAPTPTTSNCQVTPANPEGAIRFVSDPFYKDWYGEGEFWISPISITGINPSVPDSEWRWFTGGMPIAGDWPFAAGDVFTVTAERLDGPAEPVSETQSSDQMINNIVVSFPEPGCWQLTASVRDMSLTIVIDVQPQSERPDIRQAREQREALLPYPAPDTCGTGWSGPEDRTGNYSAYYWIDLDGLSVRSHDGLLWTNEPASLDWMPDEWGEISIDGRALDGGMALGYASDPSHRVGVAEGNFWTASLLFGTPGCWELTATVGDVAQSFMVWVYPADCRREEGEPLPDACRTPE
ncbi:MAG TPA: hypothetical protein VEX37_13580 [Thermomicrobiales bacterium]|nr:hypothetical protein [Thermomicrobiales bacterium]